MALSRRVVRLTAPNPGMMTGPGTNSYLVGTSELIVVDPGPDGPASDGAASDSADPGRAGHVDALAELGQGRIRWIVVTHTHPDHSPATPALAALTGAEVIGFDARDGFVPDRSVTDGFRLGTDGVTLRAVHTPGHATNHLCWLLEEERLLFSGDHVMGGSTVVIRPPDGDMAQYLESLRRLRRLDPALRSIAPGHGSLMSDPAAAMDDVIAHRRLREEVVVEALAARDRATVDELVPAVYVDVDEDRYHIARFSLWAHLRKLAAEGRVETADADDIDGWWRATG
ncbi:MAG TPA: MBL fold metallo-hydrolase [Acidimicrobiales bacterium]|nr:MBL fold metallo-hydrolase [Acidimicrobiales bacterium]